MHSALRLLPAVLLAGGAALAERTRDSTSAELRSPLSTLPADFGGASAVERPIDAEERRIAGATEATLRDFVRDSTTAFSLYVGYYGSQTQGHSIHSPRNCLPGSGWEALDASRVAIRSGDRTVTVNRYVLANGAKRALVYYWYQGRGRVEADEFRVKWDLLRDAIASGRTEEALVRVAVPLPANAAGSAASATEELAADRLARDVAALMIPSLDDALPEWPEQ